MTADDAASARFPVSAIGLGCMNLSHAYGAPPPPDAAERLLRARWTWA